MRFSLALLGLTSLFLFGCSHIPSTQERQGLADSLATQHHWQKKVLPTQPFALMSYAPQTISSARSDNPLTVYIEGDGLAWLTPRQVSFDPTPTNPIALKLALQHPNAKVAYLARPCQYNQGDLCRQKYWASHRFAAEVIQSSQQALDLLKKQFDAESLVLVGYSGGGAVAALLAETRNDVIQLITVAGNLDHKAWTTYHKMRSLTGSLNPADNRQKLMDIEQIHFVGENDRMIPPFLAQDFIKAFPKQSKVRVVTVPNQAHSCCWDSVWPQLLKNL